MHFILLLLFTSTIHTSSLHLDLHPQVRLIDFSKADSQNVDSNDWDALHPAPVIHFHNSHIPYLWILHLDLHSQARFIDSSKADSQNVDSNDWDALHSASVIHLHNSHIPYSWTLHLDLHPQARLIDPSKANSQRPKQDHRPAPNLRSPVLSPPILNQCPRNRWSRQSGKRQNRANHTEPRSEFAEILCQRGQSADEDALNRGSWEPVHDGKCVRAGPRGDGCPAIDHES